MENGRFYGKLNSRIKASIFQVSTNTGLTVTAMFSIIVRRFDALVRTLKPHTARLPMTRLIRPCSGSGATSCSLLICVERILAAGGRSGVPGWSHPALRLLGKRESQDQSIFVGVVVVGFPASRF